MVAIGGKVQEKIEKILFGMFIANLVPGSIDLSRQFGYDLVFDLISQPLKEIFDENKRGLERFGIIVKEGSRDEGNLNYAVFCDIDLDRLSKVSA